MRIVVDYDVCEANGVCERLAPEVYRLDDEDNLEVLQPEPPAELHEAVRDTVIRCPKQAISVQE